MSIKHKAKEGKACPPNYAQHGGFAQNVASVGMVGGSYHLYPTSRCDAPNPDFKNLLINKGKEKEKGRISSPEVVVVVAISSRPKTMQPTGRGRGRPLSLS